jgi:nodulation protein E
MARAIRLALASAEASPDAVDHVNAHGTGTQANDVTECEAMAMVFGERAGSIPVTANKSVLGHSLGASGAIELAIGVMTLIEGVIPPTANFVDADPACAVDCVVHEAREARVDLMISNSFAFGGLNAVLAIRRG